MKKQVYFFGLAPKSDKYLLGGKGANLNEMTRLGLPVPPGFTIATTVCPRYYAAGRRVPKSVMAGVRRATREELAAAIGVRPADAVLAFFASSGG